MNTYVKKYNDKGDLINPITKSEPFVSGPSNRAWKRGKIERLWSETLKTLHTYKLSKSGVWLMVNNSSALPIEKAHMDKLLMNQSQ